MDKLETLTALSVLLETLRDYAIFTEKIVDQNNLSPEELDEFVAFVNQIANYILHPAVVGILVNKYTQLYTQEFSVWKDKVQ